LKKTKLLIAHHRHERYRDYLREREQSLEITSYDVREPIPFPSHDAEILIGWKMPHGLIDRLPNLKWISAAAAGVDMILEGLPAERRSGIVVTKAVATMPEMIAEYVITFVLYHMRKLNIIEKQRRQRLWRYVMADLARRHTIGIIGHGPIGSRVAALAKSLGMTVYAAKREPSMCPDCDRLFTGSSWREMLPLCDFLVLAVPWTPRTDRMIGARELVTMKGNAVLINISRGRIVDEKALLDALRSETIAGAVLDVFIEEPLPEDHPFWEMENVVVTPHCAGPSEEIPICEEFLENYRNWLAGKPLKRIADYDLGY
jgi:phosphoglycerate dehydrogenase-like enzyme